jgi:hypothetical protein
MKEAITFLITWALVWFLLTATDFPSGGHRDSGACVESVHQVSWFDDGQCYDRRAKLERSADGASYRCTCPGGAR